MCIRDDITRNVGSIKDIFDYFFYCLALKISFTLQNFSLLKIYMIKVHTKRIIEIPVFIFLQN